MNVEELQKKIVNLYLKTATELPQDVVVALEKSKENEHNKTGREILEKILENVKLAKQELKPICQDTGSPIFYVQYPLHYSQIKLRQIIKNATDIATSEVLLRPNAVDILSDKNVGNVPMIHFEEGEKLQISLMLKGGGSENVSMIYQLPNDKLNAGRNFDGVKKCIIDTVFKAQGKGCSPYIIGAAMGGNIEQVAHLSKKQLLRKIDDKNSIPSLARLENQVLREINQLGIGPMGLEGDTTALAIKIASGFRHPASFFVGISINCWCLRRQNL